ncbi:mitogen-activated protein kinase kinase kinase 20-like [Carya illinoinensis]|uniref:mitogen-activated protein kinase kinase kinase 20-like n=1 Tax=Carya illinoinensis TaxID=32201 RepID=UPI001C7216EA|nr:mitogen-activated protein kinase kinase kinase 20-like [Carya illinoinensis]
MGSTFGDGESWKEKEVLDNVKGCPYVIDYFGEEITTQENGEMVYNLLLEYASGRTLAYSIKKSDVRRLPETDVKSYTWSILKGLSHIHDYGFVHCDLKPDNVLLVPTISLGGNFVVKIGDFGLAKRSEPPSDIWALGCLVCEMLTGKSPWNRDKELNAEKLLQLIGNEHEVPKIPSGVSDEAKSFLKSCLVGKPT